MKLFKMYLKDKTQQEIVANRLEQAIAAARCQVVGYVVHAQWDDSDKEQRRLNISFGCQIPTNRKVVH